MPTKHIRATHGSRVVIVSNWLHKAFTHGEMVSEWTRPSWTARAIMLQWSAARSVPNERTRLPPCATQMAVPHGSQLRQRAQTKEDPLGASERVPFQRRNELGKSDTDPPTLRVIQTGPGRCVRQRYSAANQNSGECRRWGYNRARRFYLPTLQ